jgi:hypothetical protein
VIHITASMALRRVIWIFRSLLTGNHSHGSAKWRGRRQRGTLLLDRLEQGQVAARVVLESEAWSEKTMSTSVLVASAA